MKVYFTPCSPGDPAAVEKTWMDVEPDELMEPGLVIADFVKAVGQSKKSVNDDDVEQYTKWTSEFGQEG
jgi:vacuolar protein-sorting-associated protein 4